MKGFKIPIDVAPELDEKSLEQIEERLAKLLEGTNLNIDINDESVQQAIEEVVKEIEQLQDAIDGTDIGLDIDVDAAAAKLDSISDKLDQISGTEFAIEGIAEAVKGFDDLEQALIDQKKALAVMIAEGREGTEEFQQLSAVFNENSARAKKMQDAFESLGQSVQEVGEQGSKALNFLAVSEAAGQLSSVFGGIVERGGEYKEALKQIQAQTGLFGDALDELQAQAKDAFVNGVGESAAEALKILGQSRQLFGEVFKGEELTTLTTSLAKTAKAYDKEFGEVASRAASFQKAFGTDGEKTGNLIALALKDAKTVADDVLDTIGEYSPLIAQAGFNAEEFVGILTRGNGAFNTDKLGDSIKELGIRLKAGDVVTGINDLVTNFGDRIPEALSNTLTAVAQEGQAGLKSTKDVLLESTRAIEEAFSAGGIDKNIRQGLQAAFAGTPAEEFGSDLYARAFGTPVDKTLIEAQAAAAQASIDKAFNPTFGEKVAKSFEAVEQKTAAMLVPLAKGGQALADMAPKLNALKNLVPKESFDKMSSKLTEIGVKMGPQLTKGLDLLKDKAGPLTDSLSKMGPALAGPWGIAIAAVVGGLALFFTQTEEGKEIWEDLTDTVTGLWDQAQPALKAIGSVLGSVGKAVFELGKALLQIYGAALEPVIDGIMMLFGVDPSAEGSGITDFFDKVAKAAEYAKIFIEGFVGAVQALADNIGSALGALLSGDIGGFAEKMSTIGSDAMKGMAKGIAKGVDDLQKQKLQEKLSASLELKGKLDANDQIGDLVTKFKNAKDEVTKQNLAAQIAAQVPGAINSVKTVVDETTGKVVEVYDVSLAKAEEYAANQAEILGRGVEGGKDAFYELLKRQAGELDANKTKLQEMANAITDAAARGEDTEELRKQFEKQKEATEKSAEAMRNIVTQGKGLGVTAEDVKKLGARMGDSTESSEGLSKSFTLVDQEVRKTAVSAKVLGDAFQQALSRVDGSLNTAMAGLAGAQLRIRDLTRDLAREKDPGRIKQIKQEIADTRAEIPKLNKDLRSAADEQVKLKEIQARVEKDVADRQRTALERKQRELSQEQAQIELAAQLVELRRQERVLLSGRAETIFDQLEAGTNELVKQEELLFKQADAFGLTRQNAEALLAAVRETGSLEINDLALKIGLRTAESDQKFDLKAQLGNAIAAVESARINVLGIRVQLAQKIEGVDDLDALRKEFEQRQFDIQVELGFKNGFDVVERTSQQLELLQEKIAKRETELSSLKAKLDEGSLTPEQQQKVLEIIVGIEVQLAQSRIDELQFQADIRAQAAETFDLRAQKQQGEFDRNAERVVAGYDREQVLAETFIAKKSELSLEAIEEEKAAELAAIDEVAEARQKALDERLSEQEQTLQYLEKFGLLAQAGIDTERELEQRRIDLKKEAEAERLRIEEDAEAERARAEKVAADRALAEEKRMAGESLAIATARAKKELELQRRGLDEQLRIAEARAKVSGLETDKLAAQAIGRQLEDVSKQIEEKGSLLLATSNELNVGMAETFATLFSGNEEAIADSFRGMFAVLAGALKKAGTAFIVDIVLTSPWLKSAIGFNPLLGAAITGGVTGVLTGLVSKILDPVISSITSFASGGRIDSPTFAMIGDAKRLGGSSDREWIFRDDQLWKLIASATAAQMRILTEKFDELIGVIAGQRIVGEVVNGKLYLVMQQEQIARAKRQVE